MRHYDEDTLIGEYIRLCETADVPLNELQVNALEKAIISCSGIEAADNPTGPAKKHFDLLEFKRRAASLGYREGGASRIYSLLRKKGMARFHKINDEGLLKLYNLFGDLRPHELIKKMSELEIKRSSFGLVSYRLLQDYLVRQGLIQ